MGKEERHLTIRMQPDGLASQEFSLPQKVFEKIVSDLRRSEVSLGSSPNYHSFISMCGNGRFYTVYKSASVGPGVPGESLILNVRLNKATGSIADYIPPLGTREIVGLDVEINFLLPDNRPFVNDNTDLLNWARWFMKTPVKTVVPWGQFYAREERSTTTLAGTMNQQVLLSLKNFLEGYLATHEVNPLYIKDRKKDLLVERRNLDWVSASDTLNDLLATVIGRE